ncbi:putative lipoprotein [Myxococcus hansupus]|uniref:Putative lipoprotein n=1 Tax=Pseudomyxococcus hansupus TaxID=1297742 RepID=A0A0H4X2M5_9BACT|nr:hypothetical protein [Myxococcus hansupus]AKQ68098.1 putative lipoprotein [Myxococcus hansupus]
MKRYLSPGFLLFAACATAPVHPLETGNGRTVAGEPRELAAPVRLETRSGTFLVHPNNVEDFGKLLAGEPTRQHYTAGILLAGE